MVSSYRASTGRADIDNNRRDSISICPNNEIYLLSIVDNRHLRSKKLGAVIMLKEEITQQCVIFLITYSQS